MGLGVYAVDIDQPSLDLVSAQARAMVSMLNASALCSVKDSLTRSSIASSSLKPSTTRGTMTTFWIVSPERLKPGGRLIMCGEPVVHGSTINVNADSSVAASLEDPAAVVAMDAAREFARWPDRPEPSRVACGSSQALLGRPSPAMCLLSRANAATTAIPWRS
jgi:hypothetical protein